MKKKGLIILGLTICLCSPSFAFAATIKDLEMYDTKAYMNGDLVAALKKYELDNGVFPTTEQGLAALRTKPIAEPIPSNWRGTYLQKKPLDAWGNPYNYVNDKDVGHLRSFGPDGIESKDDIQLNFFRPKRDISSPPPSFKPGTEPDGFRDIRWGIDISSLKGMGYVRNEKIILYSTLAPHPEHKIYIKENDDLIMDGIELDKIEYKFWKDKFYEVHIYVKGFENAKKLKEVVFNRFGEGTSSKRTKNWEFSYNWRGTITRMSLAYNKDSSVGGFIIYSNKIKSEMFDQAVKEKLKVM